MASDKLEEFVEKLKEGALSSHLASYPSDTFTTWKNLTGMISSEFLEDRMNLEEFVHLTFNFDCEDENEEEKLQEQLSNLPSTTEMTIEEGYQTPSFRSLKWKDYKEMAGLLPEEITILHHDPSCLLELILTSFSPSLTSTSDLFQSWGNLLGEVQLSFICMLHLYSERSLNFWKRCIHLISSCSSFITAFPHLISPFLKLIHSQLSTMEDDFFISDLASTRKNNFLVEALSNIFRIVTKDQFSLGENDLALSPQLFEIFSQFSNENSSMQEDIDSLIEAKLRLLSFVRTKFGLFPLDERSGGLYVPNLSSNQPIQSTLTDALTSEVAFLMNEEDMPVIVTQLELSGYENYENSEMCEENRENVGVDGDMEEEGGLLGDWGEALDDLLDAEGIKKEKIEHTQPNPKIGDNAEIGQDIKEEEDLEEIGEEVGERNEILKWGSKFSWRYPSLWDAKKEEEDIIMTCSRILQFENERMEEEDDGMMTVSVYPLPLIKEATMFMNMEVPHLEGNIRRK